MSIGGFTQSFDLLPSNAFRRSSVWVPSGASKSESLGDGKAVRIRRMLSRTEKIGEFPLRVSRTEKELYEEFLVSEEAEIAREMREYFLQAKQKPGVITFDRLSLWSRIQDRVDLWITETCSWKHLNQSQVPRAREAILHRLKYLVAKTIREALGAK
jgi:hypothetical protein